MIELLLTLISLNVTLTVEKTTDTEIHQFYDGQNFWPCARFPQYVVCQTDSNAATVFVVVPK